jgi:hypothetical protein
METELDPSDVTEENSQEEDKDEKKDDGEKKPEEEDMSGTEHRDDGDPGSHFIA